MRAQRRRLHKTTRMRIKIKRGALLKSPRLPRHFSADWGGFGLEQASAAGLEARVNVRHTKSDDNARLQQHRT